MIKLTPEKPPYYEIIDTPPPIPKTKRYIALITQTAGNDPTAIVLENTLGGIVVWTRISAGNYTANLNDTFTIDKTTITMGATGNPTYIAHSTNDFINIQTYNDTINTGTDGFLAKTTIIITVYE